MSRRRKFLRGRFSAYRTGDYWVTIEPLAITDEQHCRYVWSVRPIVFVTTNGTVVPASVPCARGFAGTKAQARGRAYRAALDHTE